MPQLLIGILLAAMVATPTPKPALKTIITVHSSEFCTALVLSVRPALVGLMRNDKLIDLGRTALMAGDRDVKFGGMAESSFNQQGAATWSTNTGDIQLLNNRQRQLAAVMAYNIDAIKAALANPNAPAPSGDDKAKLAAIEAQLDAIAREQRQASNIIAGNADTSDLASLYNSSSASSIERDYTTPTTSAGLNGVSPLNAGLTSQNNLVAAPRQAKGSSMGMQSTTDPTTAMQVAIAHAANSSAFNSPYEKLIRALTSHQSQIERSEEAASKAIVDAAIECQ